MNKHGVLLEVIQVLTDLNLIITKAFISSDGSWFMDVFNVTDCNGNKIWDKEITSYIHTSIVMDAYFFPSIQRGSVGAMPSKEYTSIELTDTDRPCLLSDVCVVLAIQCLEAAIERRASEGVELELKTEDRAGLLSDITRIFRKNGLSIRRAEISTKGGKAVDSFCVSEMSGNPVEAETIESIRRQIGQTILRVKQNS